MPIVSQCTAPGCNTLTMGPLCIEHDVGVTRVFVRGRPFAHKADPFELRSLSASRSFAPTLRRASEPMVAARSLR